MMLLPEHIFAQLGEFSELLTRYTAQRRKSISHPLLVTGLCEGAREAFAVALRAGLVRAGAEMPMLVLLPEERDAAVFARAFAARGLRVFQYPLRDLHFGQVTASLEFEQERLRTLAALCNAEADVVLSTPDAALQFTMPRENFTQLCCTLHPKDSIEPQAFTQQLLACGYTPCTQVDGVGQFARRGGIVDVFSPQSQLPVRIEFFGDEIETIAPFDLLSQRRGEAIPVFSVFPARELLPDAAAKKRIADAIVSAEKRLEPSQTEQRQLLSRELTALQTGTEDFFYDKYSALIYPNSSSLLDYFSNTAAVLLLDSAACRARLDAFEWQMNETATSLCEQGVLCGKYAVYAKNRVTLTKFLEKTVAVIADAFATTSTGMRLGGSFHFDVQQSVRYLSSPELLAEDVQQYTATGYRVVLLCENETQRRTVRELLQQHDLIAPDTVAEVDPSTLQSGIPYLIAGLDSAGFLLIRDRFALLSLYRGRNGYVTKHAGAQQCKRRSKKTAAERIASYADLQVGDYVVHETHGIARYEGLRSITDIDGCTRDFITLQYAGGDSLFVPCDQLDMVSKYIGARTEDGTVRLSKMGGSEWTKTKNRVRTATREMAKELIALYAARRRLPGFAFGPDDAMQRDFEQTFPYEETAGQLQAAQEIKEDMELNVPMERLLCGDVGYGKTEVALRAAFKAVENGKQVALLCPTTILAMQHFQTVQARMRGFPVNVEVLSRFRTQKQMQQALRRIRRGEVDISVGTHRLLSADVQFHDLGLVIVDEEQRFGVAQKEKLKQLVRGVDVLTLTATPIPRTLHMSMTGIRDMSILEEAPQDRVPVQTYVLEYDAQILAEALKKEMRRAGQVFWLHNRVEDIDRCAARIHAAIPQARIAVAHGKTDRDAMERIWQQMIDGEIDILVCTTIIETGVDIPNANTLIIENADCMGLSQLHQLRGRIGRSGRRAYAYFTFPKGKVLSEVATKRLQAIREYTQFGAGFKIAMRDLEIRGAGNVLGAQQHGHMEAVGYDLYIKLLNEAILTEKGEQVRPIEKCTVTFRCDANLPSSYVSQAADRIDLYRKIASIETVEDAHDIEQELRDRFGKLPVQTRSLVQLSALRALGTALGFSRIEQRENAVIFVPHTVDEAFWSAFTAQINHDKNAMGKLFLTMGKEPHITFRPQRQAHLISQVLSVLQTYANELQAISAKSE